MITLLITLANSVAYEAFLSAVRTREFVWCKTPESALFIYRTLAGVAQFADGGEWLEIRRLSRKLRTRAPPGKKLAFMRLGCDTT